MAVSISDFTVLNNGVKMPWLGLGVWQGRPEDGEHVENAVKAAVSIGYRSIDTAAGYENEPGVGRAIKACGVPREEIFITTKVKNPDQGYESTLQAFEISRKNLDLDYIDLFLVHWPVAGKFKETWRALEKVYEEGLVRAIGVSNFQIHHLEDLLSEAKVVPAVNQIELHPRLSQVELRQYCKSKGIQVEAWSPLMLGRLLTDRTVTELAAVYGKTPAQIILRWDLQHGIITIPKSVSADRIAENANLFDFELSGNDMAKLDGLNLNERSGPDPDHFDF
ncbi:aldo/keto reductase [Cohnella suwonensis]|uniref:Aldo/keto reductase n=1 Tax=Cohnella suwonensis TaxID=696072 RepID=A0ABW0M0J7_9BACL